MNLTHIGILIFPVKDSAKRGQIFSKYRIFEYFWDPNKLNRSITIDILLYSILRCPYNIIFKEKHMAKFKSTQRHLWHFPKNGQNWTFGLKSIVSTTSAYIFKSINVCLNPP